MYSCFSCGSNVLLRHSILCCLVILFSYTHCQFTIANLALYFRKVNIPNVLWSEADILNKPWLIYVRLQSYIVIYHLLCRLINKFNSHRRSSFLLSYFVTLQVVSLLLRVFLYILTRSSLYVSFVSLFVLSCMLWSGAEWVCLTSLWVNDFILWISFASAALSSCLCLHRAN